MRLFCIYIILVVPSFCFSQSVAEIKTKQQAENLITGKFRYMDFRYDSFTIYPADSAFDNFKEGDFNHDGVNDLLVFGKAKVTYRKETYTEDEIVILLGDKKRPRKADFPYRIFFSGLGVRNVAYPKVIRVDGKDHILIKYNHPDYQEAPFFYDTLYVVNDRMMPYCKHPDAHIPTRVEFRTDECYGSCPVFEMTINDNLDVTYHGIKHVGKSGEYKLRADQEDWNYVAQLIRNLNVPTLEDNYFHGPTDQQTCFTTVVFKNGDKKNIQDYGMIGTFRLSILYSYFFELKNF